MLNKRMAVFFLSCFLFIISCNEKENGAGKKNSENLQNKTTQENIFSNNSIEKIIETFSKKSRENRVRIGNFDKLVYENKNYYYARINSKNDAIYALDYSGISATSIFLKVGKVDGANLGIIENMVVNLIQVSDEKIKDSEARVIYAKILSNLGEKELSGLLTYANKITYGVRIDPETSEFIFFAKESENENNITSIQQFKLENEEGKKANFELLANSKKNKK
ncbi:lipoprotein [Leptotrichia alba]|uniref:Lipoprotein n=1 Tax=Leptotrichia alba TaxID=3239304 RepID=A0AB39V561_9FUSO